LASREGEVVVGKKVLIGEDLRGGGRGDCGRAGQIVGRGALGVEG